MKLLAALLLISTAALAQVAKPVAPAKPVEVKGTVTKTGEVRQPYVRTAPNATKTDNYSTKGNTNPYTQKPGTKKPE